MSKDFKKKFKNSEIIDVNKQGRGYNLDIQLPNKNITYVRISEHPTLKKKYCVVPNIRTDLPIKCDIDADNLPSSARKFIKENEIQNPREFFKLKKDKK